MGLTERIPDFDLYAELEVAPAASTATIDAAWRSLVKRHHPDATPGSAADDATDDRIRRLNIAHDWLTDPDGRQRYDAERLLHERTAASAEGWRSRPTPAAEPGSAAEERDWREVGRVARRAARARPLGARSLVDSPILVVALGVIAIAVVVGGVIALSRLPAIGRAPGADPVATPASVAATPTVTATAAVRDADALADTLPDRVGGIPLTGKTAEGAELFAGADGSMNELIAWTGGSPDDLIGAYRAGETPDGSFITIVALLHAAISGPELAEAFADATRQTADVDISWSDASVGGRAVAVSHDDVDPQIVVYLLSSSEAMYLVITPDPALAGAAIRALP